MKSFSLKIKILLTIVSLTILSLGVFSYLTFNSYKKDKLAFVYDHLASEAQSNAMLIKSTIENYEFFLGSIIPGVDATTKQLPIMTQKYLEVKPHVMGVFYHVPGKADFSQLTLHQSKSWAMEGLSWVDLIRKDVGFSLLDGKSGQFLLKKSLSLEGGFAAVVFRSQELIDILRSGSGRYNFVLKEPEIISKEALNLEMSAMKSIKYAIRQTKAPFGLFEVKVGNEKYFATYSKLPIEGMVLVNLIQEKKVLLIQKVFLKQVVIFLVLMGSFSLFIGTFMSRWITWHLDGLTAAANELENENFNHVVVVDSGDELGALGNAFNSMSGKIRQLLGELRKYNTELEVMVEARTKELKHLSDIQNAMLNSLGQGFVIVDKEHKILPVYSKAAVDMFEIIPDQSEPEQIMGLKTEEAAAYKEFFDLVFNQTIDFDDMVKMNPDFRSNSKNQKIQLNYASIKNGETNELEYILVIGTDKTTEIENIEKFNKEWNFSQMMMKIVSNRYSLNKVIAESLHMLEQSLSVLESGKLYPVKDVQRYIHTIKGSYSYFNIQEITLLANDFEQYLEPFYNTEKLDQNLIFAILDKIGAMQIAIECYIDRYDQVIQYKNAANTKTIPTANLDKFGALLAHNHELLEAYRESFYFVEVQPFFQMYPNLVSDLAIKLNKKIQFKIEGTCQTLPEGPWEELFGQFIHFVRNSADHGIESESVRQALGKKPVGEIKFSFQRNEQELEIRLSDDGQGIYWKKIAEKDPTIKNEADALKRIMLGGISSKDEVSEISGRGVGVSSIFSVVQRWKSRIAVINEPGKGFTIIIRVPLMNSRDIKKVA